MDPLLLTDDLVVFEPTFGAAIAVGTLAVPVRGSALATSEGRALCLEGDVTSVAASVAYSTPSCPVPGSGRLTIESLDSEQLSSVVCDGGKPVVLADGRLHGKARGADSGPRTTPREQARYEEIVPRERSLPDGRLRTQGGLRRGEAIVGNRARPPRGIRACWPSRVRLRPTWRRACIQRHRRLEATGIGPT